MNIRIYQVNMKRDTNNVAFMRYELLEKLQGSQSVDSKIYDKVFDGEVDCQTLEDVYQMFNLNHPEGYKDRSLSVSDVVEVMEDPMHPHCFYFCDSIGFKPIDFEPKDCQLGRSFTDTEKKNMISVLLVEPNKYPKMIEIEDSLEAMQKIGGGDIEEYMPFEDEVAIICNDESKMNGIQAYHGYLSFKDEPNITPELAQQIGTEFAKRVWGDRFQVVVTTHLNTKHLHCHFVVNSVSFVDGKRMQNNEKHWRYFRHIADELCRQHQLDVIENPKRGTGKNYYARKLHEAGMPNYVDSAKAVIDEAISKSNSYADFKYILRQMGATFDDSPNRKYQVLRVKGYQKNIRLTRLGDDYSLDRIKERIYENRNRVRLEPFQKGYYYRPKQYVLLTREHKIRKVGGLYGLYLHYCYKLGYLPKYQKQNPARLHYLLREDLMKLDQITAQVRLLGREHISTSEQLFSYKSKVEDEIKTLSADRTHLRNEIRKVNIDDDLLSGKRQQISALSERLKELRKEVRLCDGIAERSGVMRENLNAVLADEEKIKNNRKENRDYEHRR